MFLMSYYPLNTKHTENPEARRQGMVSFML